MQSRFEKVTVRYDSRSNNRRLPKADRRGCPPIRMFNIKFHRQQVGRYNLPTLRSLGLFERNLMRIFAIALNVLFLLGCAARLFAPFHGDLVEYIITGYAFFVPITNILALIRGNKIVGYAAIVLNLILAVSLLIAIGYQAYTATQSAIIGRGRIVFALEVLWFLLPLSSMIMLIDRSGARSNQ